MKHCTATLLLALHGLAAAGTPGPGATSTTSHQGSHEGIPVSEIKSMPQLMLAKVATSRSLLDNNNLKTGKPVQCQPGRDAPVSVVAAGSATNDRSIAMSLVLVTEGLCADQIAWVRADQLHSLKVDDSGR